MKKLAATVAVLAFSTTATASDDWTRDDTYVQIACYVVMTIDWGQTRDIAVNWKDEGYSELNPILGKHPTVQSVDALFAATFIAHTLVAQALPSKYRRVFQAVTIVVDGQAVYQNYYFGVTVRFW